MARDESMVAARGVNGPAPGPVASAPPPRRTSTIAAVARVGRDALRSNLPAQFRAELRAGQRDAILQRTVVLIWISVFVMPTTIWSFMYFTARDFLPHAIWIVLAAIGAVLVLRFALSRGAFRTHYHLAMVVLVGGVFGPTGSAIMALAAARGGSFLFAFFLIYFAFTALFPADAIWIVVTSVTIVASYITASVIDHDPALISNLIYFA